MRSIASFSIAVAASFIAAACGNQDTAKSETPAKAETSASPAAAAAAPGLKSPATYAALQPYLQTHCDGCHGGRKKKAGGYDLTSYEGTMKGGDDGVMIKAGDPDNSMLVAYLKGTKKPQMPKGGAPLPDADIQVIADWIKDGAKEK